MLGHAEVWEAIDSLAARNGLSPSGLARRSGLDPTTFNKSKRHATDGRPRWPSTESISKILTATNTSITELFGDTVQAFSGRDGLAIPLLGEAHAGFEMATLEAGNPSMLPMPARIVNFPDTRYDSLYALTVVGDSMQPLYRDGDVLIVAPNLETRPGDRVVVKLKNNGIVVKIMKSRTADSFSFETVNPGHTDITFVSDSIEWIARIVYATQ
ncbi:MAG: helix-turn-helix transcriptional regulator [Pseudomonadota bacterium]